ncbi:hypothetical protein HK101_005915 [Irineochytrium annulatum]|nr:hypothetical protein HK101_005915 [Irineochytrium annulatum]
MFCKRVAPMDAEDVLLQKILSIEQGRGEAHERLVKELLLHHQRSLAEVLASKERVALQGTGRDVNDKAMMEWLTRRFEQLEGKMEKMEREVGALARNVEVMAEELRGRRVGGARDSGVEVGTDPSAQQPPQFKRQATMSSAASDPAAMPRLSTAREIAKKARTGSVATSGAGTEIAGHDKASSEMEKQIAAKTAAPWAAATAGTHDPRTLAARLREAQLMPWLDVEQLGYGHPLLDSLADAIRDEAGVVVAYISDEYAASANCIKEFRFAKKMGLRIVPVIAIAADFKAEGICIDARHTDDFDRVYDKVLKAVKAELDRRQYIEQIAKGPSSAINDIVDAVSSNNLEAVKRLLQNPLVLAAQYGNDQSILHIAVKRSSLAIIKELVAAAPSLILAVDAKKNTPLIDAVELEKNHVVQFLLAEGSDASQNSFVYVVSLSLTRPLLEDFESTSIASILLDMKPDINATDLRNETPLIIAARQDRHRVVTELLKRGAAVNTADDAGNTPLILACRKGDVEMIAMLLEYKASLTQANGDGMTPLIACCASYRCSRAMVQKILELSPDSVDIADKTGRTALFHSVQVSNAEIFDLLRGKARVDVLTKEKWNLLHEAARQTDPALAAAIYNLLKQTPSFSINAMTRRQSTALRIAAHYDRSETVKFLLDNGADPFLPDAHNVNPFMAAVNTDSTGVVGLLLDVIAGRPGSQQHDLFLVGEEARRALLLYASARGSTTTARYLAERFGFSALDASAPIPRPSDPACARMSTLNPLLAAARSGNLPMISRLLAAGYDVNAVDDHGDSALCNAIFGDHVDAVKMLLESGADVGNRNLAGDTAVNHAAEVGDHDGAVKIMEMLAGRGADLGVCGRSNWTALHAACKGGNLVLVKFLMERKVEVGVRNKAGKLPVDLVNQQSSAGKAIKAWINGQAIENGVESEPVKDEQGATKDVFVERDRRITNHA